MGRPVATSHQGSWRMQSPHPSPAEVERQLEQLVKAWVGKDKTGDEAYENAFKETLKAFLKTPEGKKLLDALTSNKVLPVTLTALGAGLAGMLAQGKDFPSPPDIPVGGGMKIKLELKGNVRNLQGVMIGFEMPLGAVKKETPSKPAQVQQLPPEVVRGIDLRVPDNVIASWVIKQAHWNWETAGPDEEAAKLRARRSAEVNAKDYSARALAKGVAFAILDGAERQQTDAQVRLGDEPFWAELTDLRELVAILQKIAGVVANLLGKNRTGSVNTVTFLRLQKGGGYGHIPVRIP